MNISAPILLVEDDENDMLLRQTAFQATGLSTSLLVVRNGYEAIRCLSGDGIYVDRTRYPMAGLVLLDLNMPILTGFQVMEWLQRHPGAPKVVVIVLTASSNPADIARARSLGVADYRIKPTNSAHLVPMLRELQGRWLVSDQSPDAVGPLPPTVPNVPPQPRHLWSDLGNGP